ncbi:MAG: NAD(P)(+) transhydrogenase (Re/Si-specific) subunit beta [Rhodothermaceae bacterium]|nr:NAD(P)(+) transhydrogenase (Re/Si-specific) subunit beta [Rhodothermaceae bacterium]
MLQTIITLAYLVAAALFIFGLKRLSSPVTARGGNRMAALGMLIAVLAALFEEQILNIPELIGGLALGGLIGVLLAKRVAMTSMPELVAAFNGFGGIASALVAGAEVMRYAGREEAIVPFTPTLALTIALSVLIGTVTFSGSFVAYGKLNGRIKSMGFPGLRLVSIAVGLGVLAAIAWMIVSAPDFPGLDPEAVPLALAALAGLAFFLGIFLVLPIGGADMPVVVALLNSYSGLAAAATGFVLQNYALIVSGALVGASGLILTTIMCEAMNRSLLNVLLGGFGAEASGGTSTGDTEERPVRSTSPDDVAVLMSYAGSAIVVPGYGLAVAQAQHEVREMAEMLQKQGVEVRYAIHPVAGRMPGHMNVLLAEANVPYDQLIEMDDINADFPTTDVVLVVGANDVVNPAARDDENSPIYGMPILNVDEAENVIVLKRSMNTGYAGIQNELFFNPKTQMLFGDAKDSIKGVIDELKELQPA